MHLLKNNKFIIFLSLLLFILASLYGYSYLYKSHKNIEFSTEYFNGTSIKLSKRVHQNATLWLDKTIVVKGLITQIDKNGITLDNLIYCQFTNTIESQFTKNTQITIKGKFIGYDDLLEEIKLNQCIILK